MPASLLEDDSQEKLANALFAASRISKVELHFNKGLAGAPSEAIEAAKDTAMNPTVCSAFALAIIADGQGPAYPGIPDHEPDIAKGRNAAETVHRSMNQLRSVASNGGAYVSESNFFEADFQVFVLGNQPRPSRRNQKETRPGGPLLCPQRGRLRTVAPRRFHQALNSRTLQIGSENSLKAHGKVAPAR